jgi:pyruvate dehydrogenase E2 component (dihydrolipoamide acetyltransferase)
VSLVEVVVPDIGGAEGAEVIEVLVAVGDAVAVEQGLIVLESDKASMEIPSSAAGTVVEVLVAEGDELAEGAPLVKLQLAADATAESAPEAEPESKSAPDPVADKPADSSAPAPTVEPADTAVVPAPVESAAPAPKAQTSSVPLETGAQPSASGNIYAGPAVRKLAREFGVTLQQVTGTGPQGRILKEDLQQFVQGALKTSASAMPGGAGLPVVPDVDYSKFGAVETRQRSKLDKLTAANMQRSWLNVPHVTQFDEADISELEVFRKGLKAEAEQRSTRMTPMPFILKACAVALRDNPKINSSLGNGGQDLVYKQYIHIGMAVDTPAGLVVPVIRDVDQKSLWELAEEVISLADKARERKLTPQEMQGGCFTISSLGNIGGTGFTPIVNTPEVAILGVSKAVMKPVWDGAAFAPRKLLPLALSYDHRVVNGGDGGRFLSQLVTLLADIRRLSL